MGAGGLTQPVNLGRLAAANNTAAGVSTKNGPPAAGIPSRACGRESKLRVTSGCHLKSSMEHGGVKANQ